MSATQQVQAAASANPVNAVDYNGSTDYLEKLSDFAGNAAAFTGIFSAWVRLDGGDGNPARAIVWSAVNRIHVGLTTANKFNVSLTLTNGGQFQYDSTTAYTAGATWLNLLMSWDTNFSAGNKVGNLYVNDVSDRAAPTDAAAASTVAYAQGNWGVAARATFHDFNFDGCLAEVYFAPGQFLDFSVTANRRKFISATGKPVYLGPTGNLPTGSAPILYLRNPAASVNVNSGGGGDFVIGGTPSVASTSPSD